MLNIIARAGGYSLLAAVALVASNLWFSSSDVAQLSIFTLGAFVAEMAVPTFLLSKSANHLEVAFAPVAGLMGRSADFCPVGIAAALRDRRTVVRAVFYIFAIVGLLVSGGLLIRQSLHVREETYLRQNLERRLNGAFNESDKTVAMTTNDRNQIVAISGGLLRKTGYAREELLNKPVSKLIPSFDLAQAKLDIACMRGESHDGWVVRESRKLAFVAKDGHSFTVDMTIIACRLTTDRLLDRDVLFLMLSEEVK